MCLAIPGQIVEVVDEANRLAAGRRRRRPAQRQHRPARRRRAAARGPATGSSSTSASRSRKVDEEEARATLELLEGMGADYEQELEELKASVIE